MGKGANRRVFPQIFRVLPNFHECFYNSTETQRVCFLFLLENCMTKKQKTVNLFSSDHQNVNIIFACAIILSMAHASSVFLSS